MVKPASQRYDNITKSTARGWAWNRVCERIKSIYSRRAARVYTLIGDTTKELEIARKKDFCDLNVIGVDIREEPVRRWREAGGLAIQAPIEAVVAFSKTPPSAVIADFCCGLNDISFTTFLLALTRTQVPGCVVINLLRGRDDIKAYRPPMLLDMVKQSGMPRMEKMYYKRSFIILYELFKNICGNKIGTYVKKWPPTMQEMTMIANEFDDHFDDFKRKLDPQFYEYKSADSNQYFDSLAINSFCGEETIIEDHPTNWEGYDIPTIKRRLAAMEAVRAQKLAKLPRRKRVAYGG